MNQETVHAPGRRAFVKGSCLAACHLLSASALVPILSGCVGTKYVPATRVGDQLEVPVTSLQDATGNLKRYLVLENDSLSHPVVLYINKPGAYSAFHLKCTHQGQELQAAGEYLVCNAHGSEFDSSGKVKRGPATESLAPLQVQEQDGIIRITV